MYRMNYGDGNLHAETFRHGTADMNAEEKPNTEEASWAFYQFRGLPDVAAIHQDIWYL